MIGIINYGLGNVGSICNMLNKLQIQNVLVETKSNFDTIDKLILPGVGSFDDGMNLLKKNNLIEILNQKVLIEKIPILGICLGMQLMTKSSDEGDLKGLGWIDGTVHKFKFENNDIKIPHMGWNDVIPNKDSALFLNLNEQARFYHVHSYFVTLNQTEGIIAETNYGGKFTSAFNFDNIYGVQFHPEKSHKYGKQLLLNFSDI